MGKGPGHNNKGKRGHKLSHKTARRAKSVLAPADLMWEAFHAPAEVKVRSSPKVASACCLAHVLTALAAEQAAAA
jgi:hypothetical protein